MDFLKTPAARRFTATLAATATALALMTAAAVPVRADSRSDDFAKAAAAIAAIAILGSAANEGYEGARHNIRDSRIYDDRRAPRAIAPRKHGRWSKPQNHRATVLPARCAVEVRSRRHVSVAYPERCLRRAGIERRLPRQCEVSIRGRGQGRTAYDQNCMLNSGFRLQGRGRR